MLACLAVSQKLDIDLRGDVENFSISSRISVASPLEIHASICALTSFGSPLRFPAREASFTRPRTGILAKSSVATLRLSVGLTVPTSYSWCYG